MIKAGADVNRGAARRDAADSLGGVPRRPRAGGRADREESQGRCGERVRPHAAGGSRQAGRCPHGEDAARRRFRNGRRERRRPDGVDGRHQEWRSAGVPDAHRCRRQGQRRREGSGSDAVDVGGCGNPQRGRDGEGADREGRHRECSRQVHRLAEPDHVGASRRSITRMADSRRSCTPLAAVATAAWKRWLPRVRM